MGREKRPLNPTESWRRRQKQKGQKQKRTARQERSKQLPVERRDPHVLIAEIQKYAILEYEGKLNSDQKMHKKRLQDRLASLNRMRQQAGLERAELIQFDPEQYEAAKLKARRNGTSDDATLHAMLTDIEKSRLSEGTILPALPSEPCPYKVGCPGLPPYFDGPLDLAQSTRASDQTPNQSRVFIEAKPQLFDRAVKKYEKSVGRAKKPDLDQDVSLLKHLVGDV